MGFLDAIARQIANLEAPSLSQPTSTVAPPKPVTKDWKGNVISGNIYELGNTDGISVGASPGITKIMDFIKSGKAKLVDAYPYTYVKDGYLATGYSDQPTSPYYYNTDTNNYEQPPAQKLLLLDGKLYAGGNDWGISPLLEPTGQFTEEGQPATAFTGKYKIRTRADGNVFDEAVFKPDETGNIVAYSPKTWQTGSNSGGFFGSSAIGGFFNDLVEMAQTTAPVWAPAVLPAVGSELASALGVSNAAGTALANTALQVAQGKPLEDVVTGSLINQGINTVAGALAPQATTPDFNEQTAGLQDVYGGNLSVEDIVAGFDTVSPLADTTTDLDTAFLQDMGQPIEVPQAPLDYLAADAAQTEANDINAMADVGNQPVATETPPNLEGGDLGMTEEEAQNQFYEEIGLNPETVVDTPAVSTSGDTPEIPQEVTNNLTKEQIAKLLKTGINLFGGLAAASKGLSALSGGTTPTMPAIGGGTMPTIQAPTPFTGTYSGLNPYSADYYQQVQQNYNRLFPTAPIDVATPLQSWYQTQFVPDTTISNKLFGV